jgi:hypothetical protein
MPKSTKILNQLFILYLIAYISLPHIVYPFRTIEQDQLSCGDQLNNAVDLYYDGDLDAAIIKVQKCLKSPNLNESILVRAYTILTRIYLAKENYVEAEKNIVLILDLNPAYAPTIETETPQFINLVAETKQRLAQRKESEVVVISPDSTGISPWIWVGAGGAAIAIIAIVAANGRDGIQLPVVDTQPLPEPPDFPDNR